MFAHQKFKEIYCSYNCMTTVCFFSFVIYYDNVNLKVVEIIDFRKKFPKGIVDAFYSI